MNAADILRKNLKITGEYMVKELTGSSSSRIYLIDKKIFKIWPILEGEKELAVYKKFKVKNVFPSIKKVGAQDDWLIWQIKVVGDKNLENIILDYEQNKKYLLTLFNSVLDKIRLVFDTSREVSVAKEQKEKIFNELIDALIVNLQKADIKDNGCVTLLGNKSALFIKDLQISITHNDLSVGNMVANKQLSEIFFIDPREAVPYLDNSCGWGNVAIDLIGFYVSFLRKMAELKKRGLKTSPEFLSLKKVIEKKIKGYETEKIFNPIFKEFCFLLWYSVYAACRCKYCAAKERLWLYNLMVSQTKRRLTKIIFMIQK